MKSTGGLGYDRLGLVSARRVLTEGGPRVRPRWWCGPLDRALVRQDAAAARAGAFAADDETQTSIRLAQSVRVGSAGSGGLGQLDHVRACGSSRPCNPPRYHRAIARPDRNYPGARPIACDRRLVVAGSRPRDRHCRAVRGPSLNRDNVTRSGTLDDRECLAGIQKCGSRERARRSRDACGGCPPDAQPLGCDVTEHLQPTGSVANDQTRSQLVRFERGSAALARRSE